MDQILEQITLPIASSGDEALSHAARMVSEVLDKTRNAV